MKNNRRTFLIALAPCFFLGLGMLGTACSDKSSNDAALLAAYQAMLASSTSTNTATSTVSATSTVTALTVSTTTSITTATN
jgi:hypothetical protein